VNTAAWFGVMRTAHALGLRTTSTIMFGHLETTRHWARHLLRLRELQLETGGFTEFVPLPFVHMEAPVYRRGMARPGPTWRETMLMHAVARLVLGPVLHNIQVSWTKLGTAGAPRILQAGANDLGGTLMNESISRAAGAAPIEPGGDEVVVVVAHELHLLGVQTWPAGSGGRACGRARRVRGVTRDSPRRDPSSGARPRTC
jgi:FO synthase